MVDYINWDEERLLDEMEDMSTEEIEDRVYKPALFRGRIKIAYEAGDKLYSRVWVEYYALTAARDSLFAQENPNGRAIVGIMRSMQELEGIMWELSLTGQDLAYCIADHKNGKEEA